MDYSAPPSGIKYETFSLACVTVVKSTVVRTCRMCRDHTAIELGGAKGNCSLVR